VLALLALGAVSRVAAQDRLGLPALFLALQQYGVDEADPAIGQLITTIPTMEEQSTVRKHLVAELEARAAPYLAYHGIEPFRVMPASASQGEIVLGSQFSNHLLIRLLLAALNCNLGIFGKTGSGKTNLFLNLLPQLLLLGIKLVILDVKKDFHAWAVRNPDCYVIDGQAPIAFLAIPSFLSPTEFLAVFEERWRRALFSHEHGRQVLYEAWAKLTFPASLADLKRAVDGLYQKTDTYQRRDAIRGTSMRLQRVSDLYPVPFQTCTGVSLEALFDHSVVFTAHTLNDVTEFFFSFYVGLLTLRNRLQ
jgi:hypothetical protein